jgi:hypothetical protein
MCALFATMASSRPLASKTLRGALTAAPTGVRAEGPAWAFFGENVDNQGCAAPQRVDMVVHVALVNEGASALQLDDARAVFVVDGARIPWRANEYVIAGERQRSTPRTLTLAPGARGALRVETHAFVAVDALTSAQSVHVEWNTPAGTVRVAFDHVRETPVARGFENAATWRPPTQ